MTFLLWYISRGNSLISCRKKIKKWHIAHKLCTLDPCTFFALTFIGPSWPNDLDNNLKNQQITYPTRQTAQIESA